MNRLSILRILTVTLFFSCMGFKTPGQTIQYKTSEIKLGERLEFHSKTLKEDRTLNIYVPASYDLDSTKKYHVIYLLDGSLDEDFIHISGLVQFATFSWIDMIPESIVVGISNQDRKRDFTYPSTNPQDLNELPTSGGSKAFIEFLEKEVRVVVDRKYRTNGTSTIIGQSLGGLLATEILFSKPDLYNNYIIVSPSLWWDQQKILKKTINHDYSKTGIFIAVGKEGEIMESTAKHLFQIFDIMENTVKPNKLFFEFMNDKTHGDALHEAVYHAFERLY